MHRPTQPLHFCTGNLFFTQQELKKLAGQINLDNPSPRERQTLGFALLVELLAFQFASPVQWIKTMDVILGDRNIERIVELGPSPTLAGMIQRTLQLKYAVHDKLTTQHRTALNIAKGRFGSGLTFLRLVLFAQPLNFGSHECGRCASRVSHLFAFTLALRATKDNRVCECASHEHPNPHSCPFFHHTQTAKQSTSTLPATTLAMTPWAALLRRSPPPLARPRSLWLPPLPPCSSAPRAAP